MKGVLSILLLTQTISQDPTFPPLAEGEALHVVVSGGGDPIVLIPGLLGAGFTFRTLVPMLNDFGFRTVVVDLLGTGFSSQPSNADYSLEALAHRIAQVLDTLGVASASVVARDRKFRRHFRHVGRRCIRRRVRVRAG